MISGVARPRSGFSSAGRSGPPTSGSPNLLVAEISQNGQKADPEAGDVGVRLQLSQVVRTPSRPRSTSPRFSIGTSSAAHCDTHKTQAAILKNLR